MSKIGYSLRYAVLWAGILIIINGCSHPLSVKNIDIYRVYGNTAQTTMKSIGIVPTSASYDDQVILNGVADNLRRYSEHVVMPYVKGGERKVDVVANIDLRSQYDGAGVNFLITWPGFLIWTPAWNGYIYKIRHNFNVKLEDGKTDNTIDAFNIPVDLDIRHAAMNRTWLAESGWWLAYSAPALIGGMFHTVYDPKVTPLAAKEVASPIGDYIAQEIVRRIPASTSKKVDTGTSEEVVKPKSESQKSVDKSLRELKKLKKEGLITQEEFDAKKKTLLEKY